MKYICHHRMKKVCAAGKTVNIPYGSEFEVIAGFIATQESMAICAATSEDAKMHFAINDDGLGLERGALTWAIAYSPRRKKWEDGSYHRFSEAEVEMLETRYSHWLRQDVETILFNEDFFKAHPFNLRGLAKALNIKVRR